MRLRRSAGSVTPADSTREPTLAADQVHDTEEFIPAPAPAGVLPHVAAKTKAVLCPWRSRPLKAMQAACVVERRSKRHLAGRRIWEVAHDRLEQADGGQSSQRHRISSGPRLPSRVRPPRGDQRSDSSLISQFQGLAQPDVTVVWRLRRTPTDTSSVRLPSPDPIA